MTGRPWVLLDCETTGFGTPIFVVELAAQKMRGWELEGDPFRKLLNQNRNIPPQASRVHGYTSEILERDGEPAPDVYREFSRYVAGLPLIAYNLAYDLDEVLKPEWRRLGVNAIGTDGFCALRLAQRLLDPVPAGNCKLQTLRQYYRLPERGAHTALGDVMTVVDLFNQVLRPIAEQRRLDTWEKVVAYTNEEWYPSRIAFGTHKGKSVWAARENKELREWLESLAHSSNARTARMASWYLRQLETSEPETACVTVVVPEQANVSLTTAVVIYQNPELKELCVLVETARERLAQLEVTYTIDKAKVDSLQAKLFKRLRPFYQECDRLRLIVSYREQFLDTLLRQGEEEAEQVQREYHEAQAQSEREYEETAAAMAAKKQLNGEEEADLTRLWKKLVKLYHPDRFAHEPEKLETYGKLTAAINRAKDSGDLETLRRIASDPHGFILRQGWASLDFRDEEQIAQLQKLLESLEQEILSVIEAANRLHESSEFELHELIAKKPEMLESVVAKQAAQVEKEIAEFKAEAEKLANEIESLTGSQPLGEAL